MDNQLTFEELTEFLADNPDAKIEVREDGLRVIRVANWPSDRRKIYIVEAG